MNIQQMIKQLESEIEARGGYVSGPLTQGLFPLEDRRQFLQGVLDHDKTHAQDAQVQVMDTWAELNTRVQLVPEAELDDKSLSIKLWEIIDFLGQFHVRISETEHLSDRALYGELCDDVLQKPIELFEDPRKQEIVFSLSSAKGLYPFDDDLSCYHPEGEDRDSRITKLCKKYLKRRYPEMKTQRRMATRKELPTDNCFQIKHQAGGAMMLSVSIPLS